MAAAGSDPGRGIMAAEQEAEETVSQELHSASELRIVLIGGRLTGKSTAGNTILGREVFKSRLSSSAGTKECKKRTGEVSGRRVTVVDTPDLLNTDRVEIERCVSLSAPGPHAFLLVIRVYPKKMIDSRTALSESLVKPDCEAFDKVQQLFGERAVRNTMILFTRGDVLTGRTIEQYIEESGEELQQLVEKCGNRYHVFNNKNRSDGTQVTQLLDKIDNMVKGSGGCYLPISSEIYQEVEERIRLKEQELNEKHKEELRRREEEMKQKHEEEQRRSEEEMKQKYEEEQSRRKEEMKQKYEEEQRMREEMKQKYEEEQSRREEEMKQKYEEEQRRREEEMKQKYEEEESRKEEEMKQKYEEEQSRREEMKQKYEEEQSRREVDMKQKYEKEQCRREEEMKQKYEEEQRRREEDMKQKYEEELRRREEVLMEKLRKQMKEEELEKEAEESKLPVGRRKSKELVIPNMSGGEGEAPLADTQAPPCPPELRMVLLGKTGAGKSAAGNTILGREEFRSGFSSSEVTRECEKRTGEVPGRWVTVVNTPDLLDTDRVEIERCVSLSAPGPHAFLLVIPVHNQIHKWIPWQKTEVKNLCKALDKVHGVFGERAVRNTMILFTWGDHLKGRTIEQYIEEAGEKFQQLVEKCGNRYHVLNNEEKSDRTQVTQLLDKIDNMVKGSGGCYTMEMYLEAEKLFLLKEQELNEKHKEELRRRGDETEI